MTMPRSKDVLSIAPLAVEEIELALEQTDLKKEELDKILDPLKLTQ